MTGGVKAHYDCVKAFSETDFTGGLKKIDIPVIVGHGDDDQIVPISAAALLSAKILEASHAQGLPGISARAVHHPPMLTRSTPTCSRLFRRSLSRVSQRFCAPISGARGGGRFATLKQTSGVAAPNRREVR
jgi:pimeloyl-ACP methyl ester carboxylesterase